MKLKSILVAAVAGMLASCASKDNAVIDLILESGGSFWGNVTRANGDGVEAQQIPNQLNGGTIYAVVERLAPSMRWDETPKGTNIGLAFDVMMDDGQAYNRYVTSPTGASVQGHSGVGIGEFSYTGRKLIFSKAISETFSKSQDLKNNVYFNT